MLSKSLLLAWLAASTTSVPTAQQAPLTAEASPALTQEQLASALVDRLAEICAAHPEVERAFLLVQSASDGSPAYTFIPIFDRKVSDEALAEADSAYQKLFPSKGHLRLMLLARNSWKKSLVGVPPIYLRPSK
jgi:hypothetical protein